MTRAAFVVAGYVTIAVALTGAAIARADRASQPSARPAAACGALAVEPAKARVAFGDAVTLRTKGGSGRAEFTIDGDGAGSVVLAGGGVRAGDRAASFDVVARDGSCGGEARAHVEVIAPLEASPHVAHVKLGGSIKFDTSGGVGRPKFRLISGPPGATLRDDGTFVAAPREGRWLAEVADGAGSRTVALAVEASRALEPFRARASVVAVTEGGRAPLGWSGGSGSVDVTLPSSSGAHLETSEGTVVLTLAHDGPRSFEARAIDRVTHEEARIQIVVASPLGGALVPRGDRSATGDLASGDFNGDGRPDLAIGDPTRSRVGLDGGGVLVLYGRDGGTFGDRPDLVLEGIHAGDHFGATLLARDLDGDGADDLVIGAPTANLGESERGSVAIHLGSPAGLSAAADRVLGSDGSYDRFGSSLAARDLDGDGAMELVVAAPLAHQPGCGRGRAYVYRGRSHARGVVEAVPAQTIDLRDPLVDDADAALTCPTPWIDAGESLAIVDVDADGALDLAVGAPLAPTGATAATGAIDVYRGSRGGTFGSTPAWAIHPAPDARGADTRFGGGLDVVAAHGGELLVARSTGRGSKGFWVFAPKSLGSPGAAPRVHVVTTTVARAAFAGRVGTSAIVVDADGDADAEYVVSDAIDEAGTRLLSFRASALSGALTPTATIPLGATGLSGARLASWHGAKGTADGVAWLAPTRSTSAGPYAGSVDVMPPSTPAPLAARVAKRSTIDLPAFAAGDAEGTSVMLARTGPRSEIEIFAGASGASSIGDPPRERAGLTNSTGRIDRFASTGVALAPLSGAYMHELARAGTTTPVALDFDGDGVLELAIADPNGVARAPFEDPTGCLASSGSAAAARGVVHVFARDGERFVERALVVSSPGSRFPSSTFASAFATADVDGDAKSDLAVARTWRGGGVVETVLGRAFVPGKVVVACAPASRTFPRAWPPPELPASEKRLPAYGGRIAAIGDVDRDGCDDIAFSYDRLNDDTLAGLVVAFGYDETHARCHAHDVPIVVHLASDGFALGDDAPGVPTTRVNDLVDSSRLGPGAALATSIGDVTGDRVPDLVFADVELHDVHGSGPAVEVVSGAALAALCPNHVCPAGRHGALWVDGDWRVFGFGSLDARSRIALRGEGEHRFGASIALADLDGDGVSEIAVGVPDARGAAAFSGAARIFRVGKREPALWMEAFGDAGERSSFGTSIAVARQGSIAWLAVGAPASSRAGAGVGVGAAYAFRIDTAGAK